MKPNIVSNGLPGEPIFLIGKTVFLHLNAKKTYERFFRSRGHYVLFEVSQLPGIYMCDPFGHWNPLQNMERIILTVIRTLNVNKIGATVCVWNKRCIKITDESLFYLRMKAP